MDTLYTGVIISRFHLLYKHYLTVSHLILTKGLGAHWMDGITSSEKLNPQPSGTDRVAEEVGLEFSVYFRAGYGLANM